MKTLNNKEKTDIYNSVMEVCRSQEKLVKKLIQLKGFLISYNYNEISRCQQEIEIICSEVDRAKTSMYDSLRKNFGEPNQENVSLICKQDQKLNGAFLKLRSLRDEYKQHKTIAEYTTKSTSEHMLSKFNKIIKEKNGSEVVSPTPKKKGLYKRKGLLK